MTRDELYRAVATAEDVNLRGHVNTALVTLATLGDATAERLLIRGEVSKP